MRDRQEVELKLTVAAADIAALLASDWIRAAAPTTIALAATYFDTPARALAAAGFVLRVRREDDRVVQTVKAVGEGAAGLFARPEWERTLDVDETAPRFDGDAGPLRGIVGDAVLDTLAPVFTTAVQRIEARIARADGTAMLAIDRGSVIAGDRREALCEVELELESGTPAMLFMLARSIDAVVPARLGVLSKSERGYRLAAATGRKAARAEAIDLDPGTSTAATFAAIAHGCIRQFRLNEDRLAAADDTAVLHQARVGLRRLRSALSLFKDLFADDPRAPHHRDELRWLQQTLGDARDIDVLAARIDRREDDARLAAARAEAYAAVGRALASPRARAILLDLAEWLAAGAWRASDTAARPIERVAATILDRHLDRIVKRGKRLAGLNDERRHAVRIEAKKLRYATEFFATLDPGGKAARRRAAFMRRVAALQDMLGDLNDLATAPLLAERLGLAPLPPGKPSDRKALLAGAVAAWDDLVESRRFWR